MDRKEKAIQLMDQNIERTYATIREKVQIWYDYVLFTDLWWFGVALSIVPWVIWLWFRPRPSTSRLLFVGFYVAIISLSLDVIGNQLGLWYYRFHVIPILPTYVPWDLTLMPVSILFFLQIKPHWNPFWKGLVFGLASAYLAEPFFHWMRIYEIVVWKYTYSLPIQVILYLSAHALSRRNSFAHLVAEEPAK